MDTTSVIQFSDSDHLGLQLSPAQVEKFDALTAHGILETAVFAGCPISVSEE